MDNKINYWLIKSEPSTWSWSDQKKVKKDMWDGVRNYQARNNLIKMKKGDLCFFYHSVSEKRIIGIVKVVKENYQDPTDKTNKFVAVDVKAIEKLKNPVTLDDGSSRVVINDNDTVIMRGYCEKDGKRVGFGEVRTKLIGSK